MRRLLLLFAALGVLVTLAGGGGGARHAATTASEGEALIPAPGPRERSEALPPGALPAAFSYRYASNFRGWPVAPLHRAHPIRGAFLEPRLGGYHFGVDIPVDDLHPDPGAPRGHTH